MPAAQPHVGRGWSGVGRAHEARRIGAAPVPGATALRAAGRDQTPRRTACQAEPLQPEHVRAGGRATAAQAAPAHAAAAD
eukprot:scaffold28678_cov111-Isochrysis_galbana.AAC.7